MRYGLAAALAAMLAMAAGACDRSAGAREAGAAPYHANVLALAHANNDYRHVIFTGPRTQLVLMSLPAGGDIGEETHGRVEQIFVCASGQGRVMLNGVESMFNPGDVVVAPAGTRHNISNAGRTPLKIYTIYVPPNHLDGRVQATKAAAQADRADQDFGRKVEQGR